MKTFVCVLFLSFSAAFGAPGSFWEKEWSDWKIKFGKTYTNDEGSRREIWESNMRFVTKHNYEYDQGLHTHKVGMNKFADLNSKEFKALYLSEMMPNTAGCTDGSFLSFDIGFGANPDEVDWKTKGYVTPVKNQLQCGSCWAFSTTGSVEGQHFKSTGKLVSLSEQNLIDCSVAEGDHGCAGGLMDYAFEYIIRNKGIDTEASYPYEAVEGKCRFHNGTSGATVKGCVDIQSGNEKALETAVATIGPISVAIDAGHKSFQLYESGIYYEKSCSTVLLDHGVLAVGYGSNDKKSFWLVKNSWGPEWGEQGYIRMSKDLDNNCGIATKASYPVV